ncbi:FAD-dependent oxidoreductase [Pseudomonas sp. FME51]|uniref:FAD-dependent oxidoreductase n=1 Tax=Pseudomonas sp. FME51 TaxID=2742609 RepID=UPI001867435E|nr:NAD(P)/FAD-dependent oxidoreductase [Pseudomonas sp. FME51]
MTIGKHVLVVGAGPAGLITALGLARQGARVTVIDKEDDIVRSPRAMVYLPSTIKALDELGLLEDAKAVAAWGYEYNLRFPLSGNIGRLNYRTIEDLTPYAYNLHFGQDVLAEIILKHFLALPDTEIRWSTEFLGFEQSEDSVQVRIGTAQGEQVLEADWLVGCDGAGSEVRKAMGLEFEGFTWNDVFMATNVIYDFDKHGYAASTMVADPDHWCVIAKISDNFWRIAYGEDASLTEEQRLARIHERFQHFLPDPSEPYELVQANSYRVHQRSASSYRLGRAFLAGDAAHATNPIGGMGFTSGIQDAMTLINCLGGVLNNRLPSDALDWYAYERRRCYLEIANPTAIEFKRRTQEADYTKRIEDEANMFNLMADSEMMRGAMMSVFQLAGRPYQEDWRETVLRQDQAGLTQTAGAHGGVSLQSKTLTKA